LLLLFIGYETPSHQTSVFLVMTRATKSQWSQNFSAVSKVYETSTNQISRSCHEGIASY